jgi:hypothetical protein
MTSGEHAPSNPTKTMLLVILASAWLVILIGCVSLCSMAARGDGSATARGNGSQPYVHAQQYEHEPAPLPKPSFRRAASLPHLRLVGGQSGTRNLTSRSVR